MRTFYVAADVVGATGTQVWQIQAEHEEQARILVENGQGELLEDHGEISVTAYGTFSVIGEGKPDTKRLKPIPKKHECSVHIRKEGDEITLIGGEPCDKQEMLKLTATSFCALAKNLDMSEDEMLFILAKAMMTLNDVKPTTVN